MSHDALTAFNPRNPHTPQNRQADPRQRLNAAGGFTFQIDDLARVRRFLILGTEGGTYYTSEADLTRDSATALVRFATEHTSELVQELYAISLAGRAPRQNPTLFALAAVLSVGDLEGRKLAERYFNEIVRTGTQLFIFLRYVKQFRGWGRGIRRVVAAWYSNRSVDDLGYQVVKYRQREGFTHRDALRLSHPVSVENVTERRALYDWICGRTPDSALPSIVVAYQIAQNLTAPREWVALIEGQQGVSWEMLPDAALVSPLVWEALIARGLPQTALMRQLPRLTRLGVLKPLSSTLRTVTDQLADPVRLAKGRVHPINVLVAAKTYTRGSSERGTSTWDPIPQVAGALNDAFYAAYGAVPTTNARHLLALDISGSMGSPCAGMPMLSCREASAAIALVTANVEPNHHIVGFSGGNSNSGTSFGSFYSGYGSFGARPTSRGSELTPLDISPRQRLDDAVRVVNQMPFGPTDCALPMQYALKNNIEVDCFSVYTDNETWYGGQHPHEALNEYRRATGIDAKLVVLSLTATGASIADPSDAGMLDIAGLDSAVPQLISEFAAGALSGSADSV